MELEQVINLLKPILNKQIQYTPTKHSELCQNSDTSLGLSLNDSEKIILPINDTDFNALKEYIMNLPAIKPLNFFKKAVIQTGLTKDQFNKLIRKALIASWKEIKTTTDICSCKQQSEQLQLQNSDTRLTRSTRQEKEEEEEEEQQQQQQQQQQRQQQTQTLRPKSLTEKDMRAILPEMHDDDWKLYSQEINPHAVVLKLLNRQTEPKTNPFRRQQRGGVCSTEIEIDKLKEQIVEIMIEKIKDKIMTLLSKIINKGGGRYKHKHRVTRFKYNNTTKSKTKKNKYRKQKKTKRINHRKVT